MKKVIATMLSALCVIPCFACAGKPQPEIEQPKNPQKPQEVNYSISVRIQDSEGIDKCFWNDGKVYFDAFRDETGRQKEQTASGLSIGEEYDFCFIYYDESIGQHLYSEEIKMNDNGKKYEVEFEYDQTKLEIKENPDVKDHYTLKVFAPLKNENLLSVLTIDYLGDLDKYTPLIKKLPVKLNTEELSEK